MYKILGRPQLRNLASARDINLNTTIAGPEGQTVNHKTSTFGGTAHASRLLLHPFLGLDTKITLALRQTRVSHKPGPTARERLDIYNLQSGNVGAIWTTHYTIFNNGTPTTELATATQATLGTVIGYQPKQEILPWSMNNATAKKRSDENAMQPHFMPPVVQP